MTRKIFYYLSLFLLFSTIIKIPEAKADLGVFNPKIEPHEMFINTPTLTTISAEIGIENIYTESVELYQTTDKGEQIALVGRMYDDGKNGDRIIGDTVFTIQHTFNETEEKKLYFKIVVNYKQNKGQYFSSVMEVDIFEPLSPEAMNGLQKAMSDIKVFFISSLNSGDNLDTARQKTLEYAKNISGMDSANVSGRNMSIEYMGVRGIVWLDDPNGSPMQDILKSEILNNEDKVNDNQRPIIADKEKLNSNIVFYFALFGLLLCVVLYLVVKKNKK